MSSRSHRVSTYIKSQASGLSQQVQHRAERARDWYTQTLDESPLAMGAAFFTLGMIGGLVVPATRPEDRLLGPTRDRLVEGAQQMRSQLIERGQETAQRAVGAVKEAVSSAAEESRGRNA